MFVSIPISSLKQPSSSSVSLKNHYHFGERTHLAVEVTAAGEGSTLALTAYPLNAVGQKLMFGARKGVTKTVVSWFWAHVDNQLKSV